MNESFTMKEKGLELTLRKVSFVNMFFSLSNGSWHEAGMAP